jgi:hypothetical protein
VVLLAGTPIHGAEQDVRVDVVLVHINTDDRFIVAQMCRSFSCSSGVSRTERK